MVKEMLGMFDRALQSIMDSPPGLGILSQS